MLNKNCTRCKNLCTSAETVCMSGKGVLNPDLMIIDEAPGREEDIGGEPFVGRAGRYFSRNLLKPLNIDENAIYIDHAVRCRPTEKNSDKKRTPTRGEILACRDYLEEEIRRVKPKVVVFLGNVPLCSLLFTEKIVGITKWRGRPMWCADFGCWIVATHHPVSLMTDAHLGLMFRYDQAVADLRLAVEMVSWHPPHIPKSDVKHLTDTEEIVTFLKTAHDSGCVAVDTETASLDTRDTVLGVSLCYKFDSIYHSAYMEWRHFEDGGQAGKLLGELLQSHKVTKIFHNVAFDQKVFYYHGFLIDGVVHDTMIMAHLLDENFSVGLKERTWINTPLGGYETPLEKYKFENKFARDTSYAKFPVDVLAPYAAIDTQATYMLFEGYVPRLQEQEMWPLYTRISIPVRQVITQVEINGLHVDMDVAETLDKKMTVARERLEKAIHEAAGKTFNFMSTPQLSKYLFEECGAPGQKTTATGRLKCDKNVLRELAKKGSNRNYTKMARLVLKYKYICKLQETYIGQAREYVREDRRIHSNYNITGTVTGRPSNSKPCINNIPKDRLIRSLYRATPGNVLVEADVKSAEMRVIAAESQDPVLLEIIESGQDVHNLTYNEMFSKPKDYVPTSAERRVAKAINFGLIYGITSTGLSRTLEVSKDEAQIYIDRYFKKFAKVAEWIDNTIREARETGYVTSFFKRRRRLPNLVNDDKYIRWGAERQAMNSPIQGAASDYTFIALIRVAQLLKKYGLDAKLVHTVYDNILVDTPKDEVEKVIAIMKQAFRTPVKAFPIGMDVDIEVNEYWGQKNDSNLDLMLKEIL